MTGDILGVDIGLHGALVLVRACNSVPAVIALIDVPLVGTGSKTRINAHAVDAFLQEHPPTLAVLEHTQAFPGQGRSSCFSFGRVTGSLETILTLRQIPVEVVHPGKWKRALGLDRDKENARALALAAAGLLRRKSDHHRGEALLLAHWLITQHRREAVDQSDNNA